jgi:hypothetical protein
MGNSSRREAIYKCPTFEQSDIFNRVHAMMKWAREDGGKGFSYVLNWYLNRDLTNFNPYAPAPKTKYKDIAIAASKTPLESFAQEITTWVKDSLDGIAAFTPAQLQILCEKWGHDNHAKKSYILKALLAQGEYTEEVVKVDGKAVRVILFDVRPKVTKTMSPVSNKSEIARKTFHAISLEMENSSNF